MRENIFTAGAIQRSTTSRPHDHSLRATRFRSNGSLGAGSVDGSRRYGATCQATVRHRKLEFWLDPLFSVPSGNPTWSQWSICWTKVGRRHVRSERQVSQTDDAWGVDSLGDQLPSRLASSSDDFQQPLEMAKTTYHR